MNTTATHRGGASAWADWGLVLRNLFLPIFCRVCGRRLLTEDNRFFCPDCWDLVHRIDRPFCTVCGRPRVVAVGYGLPRNSPCADCRERGEGAWPFGRIYGACLYGEPADEAVKLFKFEGKRHLAQPLAELMRDFAARELDRQDYDCLVPVPLHTVRRRERGFNQSLMLAHEILPAFPNASVVEALRRVRPTRTQSRIKDPAERRRNVAGAFGLAPDADLSDSGVLLIDDVVTSGETVSECASVLLEGGADAVDVFAFALAGPVRE